ncbi:MAG: hypothetical protein NC204_05660 [Candidatus Amulumruptor caecigallinarius]|nr:hypothetical protein [Candidatus Amulumruptor caecigallinarius]
MSNNLLSQWLEGCLQCNIPAISTDKSAKILAMVYVLGGSHSSYTYSTHLRAALEYIKKRFHIDGGETPDANIIPLIRQYSQELETAYSNATERSEVGLKINWYPEWAIEIAKEYTLPTNNSI